MAGSRKAVFLSYASEDAHAAARICASLRAAGIEAWFDQSELRGGESWDRSIRQQIHDCALFIAVISSHSDARGEGYFRREWRLAVDRTHDMADDEPFLVPVVIDETSEAEARVPDSFRDVQWTRLPGGSAPAAFTQRVAQLLQVPAARAVPAEPAAQPAPRARQRAGTAPVGATTAGNRRRARAWLVVAGAVVLVGIGYVVTRRVVAGKPVPPPQASVPVGGNPAAAPIQQQSVAVLPFADMSEKHDQEYLADGMAEEIIERLSQVPKLRVPARASSFYFKGKPTKVEDIARELRVANVVEGSVRKSGNHLRIGAQLVRVADGYTIWSETFDRQLQDVFKIQDEIATAVANALQITLSGGALTRDQGGTRNLEAYQQYLQAWRGLDANTAAGIAESRALLERALQLDPNFGSAMYLLSEVWIVLADRGQVSPEEGYNKRARALATRATELSPGIAGPYAALGYVYRVYDWNWPAASAAIQRGLALNPGDILTLNVAGLMAQTLGRFEDAERYYRKALDLDPFFNFPRFNHGNALYLAGRYAAAEAEFHRVLDVAPDFAWVRAYLAKTLLAQGKPQEALAALQLAKGESGESDFAPEILLANGRKAEADAIVQRWEKDGSDAYYLALYYAYSNNRNLALHWLERAYVQRDPNLVELVGEPLVANLKGDPRFTAFLRKMNLPE